MKQMVIKSGERAYQIVRCAHEQQCCRMITSGDGTELIASVQVDISSSGGRSFCFIDKKLYTIYHGPDGVWVNNFYFPFEVQQSEGCAVDTRARAIAQSSFIVSPLAGRVAAVWCVPGKFIRTGEPLLSIESMKMDNEICADRDGVIKTVFIAPGNVVQPNERLVMFEEEGEGHATEKYKKF